jgi:hypothetical protein
MNRTIESSNHVFTGVIPAEPGWRLIVTDGKTTHLVPIVGWGWERCIWTDGETTSLDEPTGEPLVAGVDGPYLSSASDMAETMSIGATKWRIDGVLAPGKGLADKDRDGWETIEAAEGVADA